MQDTPMMDDWRYRRGFEDAKRSVRAEMDIAISSLQQQLAAAREALQAAEADAARYRFIRANCVREWESDMPHNKGAPSLDLEFEANGHDLDAAIDATLQRDRQP